MSVLRELAEISGSAEASVVQRGIWLRVVEAAFAAVPLAIMIWVIGRVLDGEFAESQVPMLIGALIGCLVLQYIFAWRADHASFISGYRMMSDLRLNLADRLRLWPLGRFSRNETGDIVNVMTENVGFLELLFTHTASQTAGAFALPLFTALILAFVDWRLALIVLASLPLAFAAMGAWRALFQRLSRKRMNVAGAASARLLEYVQGIKVIRAFGLVGHRFPQLVRVLTDLRNASMRLETFGGLALMLFSAVLEAGLLAVIFAGLTWLDQGLILPASLALALLLANRFYGPMTEAAVSLAKSTFMARNLDRIRTISDVPALPEPARPHSPSGYDIAFEDVSFSYVPGQRALDRVSVMLPSGSFTALVGESGAGKTTFAELIPRMHDVSEGVVRIGGVDVRDIDTDVLLASVAIVFQDVYLFADTIGNNIAVGKPGASAIEIEAAARAACAHDFISALPLGYDTRIGEGGLTLSGGERQRISIARAILKDAPIILLDEATASVDPESEAQIQAAFGALIEGRTVIVIAHRLNTITDADQILLLDKGRIAETGKHEDLLARRGLYARFWAEQTRARAFAYDSGCVHS